ncbi:hypothetical protein [Flavobacterium seoulense]|uniref:Knr4/Smi1-like domain-containing protein n=1 Tax=Flavobacterium seoulense TaxID=1492738 RepID=A0A066WPZ6_9FLAO|nr:hypothetical protein [Flavobacterium seoulense]KDN54648.1 hypothetical protein FEM21_23710 [Flavobacterium seoulense]
MEIEFLKNFSQNNIINNKSSIIGISLSQIEELEKVYNNGKLFPKVLRELLFLAGDSYYALKRIWYKNQQEIQTLSREWLQEYNITIEKPFFVIAAYGVGESFSFVYLDESENPIVHQTFLPSNNKMIIKNLDKTLTDYINLGITFIKDMRLLTDNETHILSH